MRRIGLVLCAVAVSLLPSPRAGAADLPDRGLYEHLVAEELSSAELRRDVAEAVELVTVRGGDAEQATLDDLLGRAPELDLVLYRRGSAVSAQEAEELASSNPAWIARDRSGKPVESKQGAVLIDITNPDVRRWLADGLARDTEGGTYDGIYLDVLGAFFSDAFYTARPVIDGAPLRDEDWRDASAAVIREVKEATGLPVIANGFGLASGTIYASHRADADVLIDAADGIQIEQFTRTGKSDVNKGRSPERWRNDVEFLREVSGRGKLALVNTRVRGESTGGQDVDPATLEEIGTYALASFLLGVEGPALFRFGGSGVGEEGRAMSRTMEDIGEPQGPAREEGGAWTRRFTGGSVAVNPTRRAVRTEEGELAAHSARITLSGAATATPVPGDRPPDRDADRPVPVWPLALAGGAAVAGGAWTWRRVAGART